MTGRTTYLTIRCPWGCETWLHPRASVFDHRSRCRNRPWVDDVPDVAVVPVEYTAIIRSAVEPRLVGTVSQPGQPWVLSSDGRMTRRAWPAKGTLTVESPIAGVRARRWLTVAIAAGERFGDEGLARALDPSQFHRLQAEVLTPGAHVECDHCGAFVDARRRASHQATNAACRWRQAAAQVRAAWADGWRDPYSVDNAPMTWSELRARAVWRRRLRTITFPRWIAVLLGPDS